MRKILVFILVAATFCAMFASCDANGADTDNADTQDSAEAVENTENTEDKTIDENEKEILKDDNTQRFVNMQSVILMGQSNMSGRGRKEYVDPISDDRIFMMRNNTWVKMKEPIHTDSTQADIGIAASFAKAFVETFDCELGLVPTAVGGSGLSQWKKGADYYENALKLAKEAQKTSEICAILWHQGESNRGDSTYAENLKRILDSFIDDLGLDKNKIVIVTGELGGWEYVENGETKIKDVEKVNNALASIADEKYYPNYGVAQWEGLTNIEARGGTSHFDSPSLRVFGYRYFECFYEELTGKECTYEYSQDPNYYRITP